MQIRKLTPSDAEAYQELMLSGAAESPSGFGVSVEELRAETMRAVAERLGESTSPASAVFGGLDAGILVGVVGVRQQPLVKMRHRGVVGRMYVAPSHRGRGLARRLLEAALSYARGVDGLAQLSLVVDERNAAAIGLYRSIGFVPFGLEPRELKVAGEYRDSVHMWLKLD